MGLKDDIGYLKKELSSEEKFLESFVKIERFYKKYKFLIILVAVLVVAGSIGVFTIKKIQNSNKVEANLAFNKLLENPKNKKALKILKEKNAKLHQIALYLQARKNGKVFSGIQVEYLKELVAYEKALNSNDTNGLSKVSMENNFLLKEFAIFNKALILTQNGKYKNAKTVLKLIPNNSKVANLAKKLEHYLITK